MKWFIPNWTGDYRLLSKNGSCVLEVERPTPHEKVIVQKFLKSARKKGWISFDHYDFDNPPESSSYRETGKHTIKIDGPVDKAGQLLVRLTKPIERTITAVKFSDGKLEVINQAKSKEIEAAIQKAEAEEAVDNKRSKAARATRGAAAAASVARPTTCCPNCVPGSIERASEALLAFLTDEQHERWAAERSVVVEGNLTGHRYLLSHRHSPRAIQQTKICYDLDDRAILHFHQNEVPPEEEILAAKLVLEHREHWLRNEATCGRHVDVFKNPFGNWADGMYDSQTMTGAAPGLGIGTLVGLAMRNR